MPNYPTGKRKRIKAGKIRGLSKKVREPNSFVLKMLLNAAPYYVSGSILAEKLNMSRVGVWSRIDKLRKSGLTIEASQNLGYRLAGEPNQYSLPLIKAWLSELRKTCDIFTHDQIDSTNSEVERLLANGQKAPFAVLANKQLTGRGRLGRSWHSPKGGNLYLSIGFRPNINAIRIRNFTLWQGIKICKFIQEFIGSDKIKVKWPNDLYYEGKKIAGMLTEASIDCERIRTLVFGLGMNVNIPSKQYPSTLSKSSISLQSLVGGQIRLHELSAKIIKVVLQCYENSIQENFKSNLTDEWKEVDAIYGKKVEIKLGKEIFTGKALGVDQSGNLRIKLRNGRIKIIQSGEVIEKL